MKNARRFDRPVASVTRYRPYNRRAIGRHTACIGGSMLVSCIMPTYNRRGFIPVA